MGLMHGAATYYEVQSQPRPDCGSLSRYHVRMLLVSMFFPGCSWIVSERVDVGFGQVLSVKLCAPLSLKACSLFTVYTLGPEFPCVYPSPEGCIWKSFRTIVCALGYTSV